MPIIIGIDMTMVATTPHTKAHPRWAAVEAESAEEGEPVVAEALS